MKSPGVVALCLALLGLSACYAARTDYPKFPNPPFSPHKGLVILFTGLAYEGQDLAGSGMDGVTEELRAQGITAEVRAPPAWDEAARQAIDLPGIRGAPIAVVGYSLGGAAVTEIAGRLKDAGIPVQTLVAIEAWHPYPVPCNVRKAVDIFNSDSFLSLSTRLTPGPGFTGELEKINYSELSGHRSDLNHWTISWSEGVHRLVRREILDGDHVRRRPAPPGEAACLAGPRAAGG